MATVLFICIGNYYRSRFAEAIFNHYARRRHVNWRASSRGLVINLAQNGDLSPITEAGLRARGINLRHTSDRRRPLSHNDLEGADIIVAVDEVEQRPLIARDYPAWSDKIVYWHVRDVADWPAARAMGEIEHRVLGLIDALARCSNESEAP